MGQIVLKVHQADNANAKRRGKARDCHKSGFGGSKLVVPKKIGPRKGRKGSKAGMNSAGPKNFAIQAKGQSSQ